MKEQEDSTPAPEDFIFDVRDFPGCCAVSVLSDFYADDIGAEIDWTELSKAKVADELVRGLKHHNPLTLAVTILKYKGGKEPSLVHGNEQAVANKLLRKAGYRQLVKFLGRTGNLLCLWGLVRPNAVPKKKAPAKKAPAKRR